MPKKAVKKREEKEIEEPMYEEGGSGVFGVLVVITLILILGGAGYGYFQFTQRSDDGPEVLGEQDETNTADVDLDDPAQLVAAVKKHILLPEGDPTVATIDDVDALKETQAFFALAQNGDKLLIYADRAVIYSPTKDVIINMGPVFVEDNEEATEPLAIEVRNGSGVAGMAKTLGDDLNAEEAFTVIKMADASRTNYGKTLVVNLGDQDVTALASALGAEVVTELPAGEKPSEAEVVVIIGQN